MNDKLKCSKISVDCVENDPVDVRCGGPEYLGFDFFVKEEETEEMKTFIKTTLDTFEVPVINLYVSLKVTLNKKDIWDKKRIVLSIKENADELITESSFKHKSYCKK